MIARRSVLPLIAAGMIAICAGPARAQSGAAEQPSSQAAAPDGLLDVLELFKQAQAQQLEGSWVLTISPAPPPGVPAPPSFYTYLSVSRGGAVTTSGDPNRPFDGPQHGSWAHLSGDEFAFTLRQDRFDAAGNFQGTWKGRTQLTVTGKDEFVGVASVEFRDVAGNVILARCATLRAARIKVEPLAPQCQSVTPPQ